MAIKKCFLVLFFSQTPIMKELRYPKRNIFLNCRVDLSCKAFIVNYSKPAFRIKEKN